MPEKQDDLVEGQGDRKVEKVERARHLVVFGDHVPVVENRDAGRCRYLSFAFLGDFAFALRRGLFLLAEEGGEG